MMHLFRPILLAALLLAAPATAQDSTLFMGEVNVEASGKDATEARAAALQRAERLGLADLLEKLAPDQKDSILSALDDKRISALVKGTEVLEEKVSGNRYRATLKVSYSAEGVSALIDRKVSAPSGEEVKGSAMLLIPLLEPSEGQLLLWEEGNAWKKHWSDMALGTASGQLVVPYGDNIDGDAMGSSQAMAANFAAYQPLMRRYGVRDVAIVQARVKEEGRALDVIRRIVGPQQNEVSLLQYRADPQEDLEMLMERAAKDIAGQLAQFRAAGEARRMGSLQGEQQKQMALVSFTTMQGWKSVRDRLKAIAMVEKLELLALGAQQADVTIIYRGTPDALAQALSGAGLTPRQSPRYWLIEGK